MLVYNTPFFKYTIQFINC